ncbi:replication protein A 32 kDa subunit-A-like isoform X3 [Anarhichas minor]|uniref:replication protein A 32 kDa subunit-A-like isoform X3 n=1 Tax=Anarhichas minor TaxID=65739 RepID=UPI003F7376B6
MWNQGKVANVDVTPNKENNIFLLFVLKWLKASFSRYTACSQPADGMSSQKAETLKRTTLQILPCTVSQLLSASQDVNDTFAICGWELNQVSVVGIIRGFAPFVKNIKFSVDDMTGPPLNVKQWVNTEDCTLMTFTSPGTYVKVTGSLRSFNGQRSLLAVNSRCIEDLNEITSHMLEVVHAHMQLFGKVHTLVEAFDKQTDSKLIYGAEFRLRCKHSTLKPRFDIFMYSIL